MAAKKNVAVTPAFTGRNVSLSEISQASGIGIATLKKGLIAGAVDFGYAIPCGKGNQHRYYCPDISRPDISIRILRIRTQIPKPPESL